MPQFLTSQAPKKRSLEEERIDELTEGLKKNKAEYENSIAKLNAEHTRALDKALSDLRSELVSKHTNEMSELKASHDEELTKLKNHHDEELTKLHEADEQALSDLRSELETSYNDKLIELKSSHDEEMKELKSAHDKNITKLNSATGFIFNNERRYEVSLPLYINTISDYALDEFDNKKTIRELILCLHFEANGKPITWFAELNEDFIDTDEFGFDIDFEFLNNESKNVTLKLKRSKESPITIEVVMAILKTMNLYITNKNVTVFTEDEEIKTPSSFDMIITHMEIRF